MRDSELFQILGERLGLFIVDSKNKETLKVVGTLRVP